MNENVQAHKEVKIQLDWLRLLCLGTFAKSVQLKFIKNLKYCNLKGMKWSKIKSAFFLL